MDAGPSNVGIKGVTCTEETASISLVFPGTLCAKVLVEGILPTLLGALNVLVFGSKAFGFSLQCQGFFNEGFLAVFLSNPTTEELSRALNNSPHLREFRRLRLPAFLFVMSLRIQHRAHSKELQVSSELWSQLRLRQVKPIRSCSRLVLQVVGSQQMINDLA